MKDLPLYNLRRVLKRCEPQTGGLLVGSHVRGEFAVECYEFTECQAFKVSRPTGAESDVWFKLEDEDLLESVLRLVGGFAGDEVTAAQCGRRLNIEHRHGITLEEYERRVANGTKACSVCRLWLPFISFHAHRGRSLGLSAPCRDCAREQSNRQREARGLQPRENQGQQRRPRNKRGEQTFEDAPLEESVVVDNFADGLGVILKQHGARVQPVGLRWCITFAEPVRYLATANECGIFRFEDGSAMLVSHHGRQLVASAINVKGEA